MYTIMYMYIMSNCTIENMWPCRIPQTDNWYSDVFCTVYVTQFQAKWNYARCICYALIDNFGAQQLRKNYRIIIFFLKTLIA